MILLFKVIGCLQEIGFCEVIQSVIFDVALFEVKAGFVNHTDNLVFVILRISFPFLL